MRLLQATAYELNEGQDLLEYAMLAALIALVALGAVTLLGDHIEQIFLAGHWPKHLISNSIGRRARTRRPDKAERRVESFAH